MGQESVEPSRSAEQIILEMRFFRVLKKKEFNELASLTCIADCSPHAVFKGQKPMQLLFHHNSARL